MPTNTGLGASDVRDITSNLYGYLFAGTIGGAAYASAYNGDSWMASNNALADLEVTDLLTTTSGYLFALTRNGKLFRTVQPVTAWAASSVVPTGFTVAHNFPNPFDPTTEIRFEILLHGFVTLTVFNVLGQQMATIVNAYLPMGKYRPTISASALPSCTYCYRLHVSLAVEGRGKVVRTKRMVVVH